MKKQVVSMVLTAAMTAAALAGCGSTASTSSSASSSSAASTSSVAAESTESTASTSATASGDAEAVTLTVWSPQEDQDGDNWLATECEAFAAAHPEWDITFNYGVCSEGDAKTQLATDAEAGADVYMFANDQIPDLISSGTIAQLGGDVADQVTSSNSQTIIDSVTYEDGIYGVPFTANTWFMYYDTRVFSEDDVKNLDTMLEKGKVSFPLSNSWYIAAFYVANGCTLFGEDGTDEAAGIDFGDGESDTKASDVTNYLVDLVANENFSNDTDGSALAGLADGSVNAMFSGSWDYEAVVEALGEENVGIAQLPTITINGTECQMKSFAGSKAIGVNPNTQYPEAAVALAGFLGSTDAQQAHYEMRDIIPCDTSIDVSSDALAKAQNDTIANTSTVQPLVSAMSQYWTPAQSMGEELVAGTVTHDNAVEKTAEMNTAMNTSTVE